MKKTNLKKKRKKRSKRMAKCSINQVILAGNLVRDVEMRSTASGYYVATFTIANNRRYKKGDGTMAEEVAYVDVEVWNKLAENCQTYLKKGSAAIVCGRIKMDQWVDQATGGNRTRLKISAMTVDFLDSAPSGQQRPPETSPLPLSQQEAYNYRTMDAGDEPPF